MELKRQRKIHFMAQEEESLKIQGSSQNANENYLEAAPPRGERFTEYTTSAISYLPNPIQNPRDKKE